MTPASSPQLQTGYDSLSDEELAAASTRSPVFDVAAVASVAALRNSNGQVPLDLCVPELTAVGLPLDIDSRSLRVLGRVDGRRSLKVIADELELSLSDTIEAFLELVALGIVTVGGEKQSPPDASPPSER